MFGFFKKRTAEKQMKEEESQQQKQAEETEKHKREEEETQRQFQRQREEEEARRKELQQETERIQAEEQRKKEEEELRKIEEFERKRQEYKKQQEEKAELWKKQEEERKLAEELRKKEEEREKFQRLVTGEEMLTHYIGKSQYFDEDEKELRDSKLKLENYVLTFTFEDNSSVNIELPDSCYFSVKVEQSDYWRNCYIYNELGSLLCVFSTDYKLLREKDENRRTIEQSELVEKHFDLLNKVVSAKREAFEKRANEIMNQLLQNSEVTNLLVNYLAKTDHNYFLDTDYLVAFEKTLFLKDGLGKGTLACDPTRNDWPETVDRDRVNIYYKETYFMLVKVLINKNVFETTQDAIYIPWLTLRNLAVQYFHDVFAKEYGNHFASLSESDGVKDYVSIYAKIDTINIELVTNASYLTYFYLKRRNASFEEYLDFYHDFKREILQVIKNKELSNFEASLLGTSNKSSISISDVDMMDGHEFEHFIGTLFRKMGYSAEVTKGSGDQGIDVIAEKDGRKFGIQTKCYGSAVNNKAIQETAAGIKYYKLDKGIVVTNNFFTDSAIELAASNGIILWDRTILKEKIEEFF